MNVIRQSLVRSLVAIAVSAVLLSGCGKGQEQQHAPPPPEVTVQTVEKNPVPLDLTYTARTVGSREVEVRARVGGILIKRRYEEGGSVKQGQPMFLIDPEPVRARLASARAEVAVAKARLEEARRQHDRVVPLFEKNAVSQSRRDEVVSAFEVAQASLQAAESAQRMAQLDLEYTDVRAPISGLTSREVMSEGSLVSTEQSSSLLTKIVQVDPLYIEFSVPEAEASIIRGSLAPANRVAQPTVRLVLENGQEYPDAAKVTFVDNAVDVNSGTVRVRAVLKNPEAQLIPGQFIRARVEGVQLSNVVTVPRKAVMSSAQGQFIWLVNGEQKVEFRPVQVGRSFGNNIIVTEGLAPGDRYIVEGVLKVQPGIQVSAVGPEAPTKQAEQQPAQKETA
ncbi:hemolysin D [Steroidobacter agaridevorans]|uniref:Hemolysin D n=1 Tax=Steroidobacter agaridevorans TaxID=2695856 RepID=A0A829YCD6_9GAMM|nr:efflux RND transporter periplasmic adaptor subunit [Steroidobacter agaridevorans]GFE81054.1 hemolysin D [Steroidobacter agaridevorans]GFE89061.1 hemolysin D [Steroidobacter agaridevorans]